MGLFLDTTSKKLQAFTDATATTTEPVFNTSYGDTDTTIFSATSVASNDGSLTGSTAKDIIAAPSAGKMRAVVGVTIYNADTVTHTITVRILDGATPIILGAFSVPSTYSLFWAPDTGWQVGAITGPGSVTSVALTVPTEFTVSGSPITSAGTLAITKATETANTVWAGPTSGGAAQPTFRAIVAADLPSGFSGLANPTGTVGLSTVNGVLTTAMRSDGAPPLDQGIVPSWTGIHTFTVQAKFSAGSVGTPSIALDGTTSGFYHNTSDTLAIDRPVAVTVSGAYVGGWNPGGYNQTIPGGGSSTLQTYGEAVTNLSARRYSNDTTSATFLVGKARGTIATPLVPVTGDFINIFNAQMFTGGTTFTNAGSTDWLCSETSTVDTTHLGMNWRLRMAPIGSGTLAILMGCSNEFGITMGGNNSTSSLINTSRVYVATAASSPITPTLSDATTNVMSDVATWNHNTSGTAAASFGSQHSWSWENASGVQVTGGRYGYRWLTATNGAEDSEFVISTIKGGTLAEKVRITPNGYVISPANARVTADFTKTTDTTLANITGLTVNVSAAKTYHFKAWLPYTADATGGTKFAIAGTATATDIRYQIVINTDGGTAFAANPSTQTALAGSAGQAGATTGACFIDGTITVNAAGTLTVQFAQNASNASSSVKRGATFIVTEID